MDERPRNLAIAEAWIEVLESATQWITPDLGPALVTRTTQGAVLQEVIDSGGVLRQALDGRRLNWYRSHSDLDHFVSTQIKTDNGVSFSQIIGPGFEFSFVDRDFGYRSGPPLDMYVKDGLLFEVAQKVDVQVAAAGFPQERLDDALERLKLLIVPHYETSGAIHAEIMSPALATGQIMVLEHRGAGFEYVSPNEAAEISINDMHEEAHYRLLLTRDLPRQLISKVESMAGWSDDVQLGPRGKPERAAEKMAAERIRERVRADKPWRVKADAIQELMATDPELSRAAALRAWATEAPESWKQSGAKPKR